MTTARLKRHDGNVVIRSTRDTNQYWQCGQWVEGAQNATLYPTEAEANTVALIRGLRNVEIITL